MFVSSQDEITVDIPATLAEDDCSDKGAFCKLKNTLIDFQNSIVQEMTDAKARRDGEVEWCTTTIAEQSKTVAERKQKVDDLTEHLDWLKNEKEQREKDRDDKLARIQTNLDMLKKFKKKRCDSNLIFVKNLREHMDAIQIMRLLKDDIRDYFKKKAAEAANPKGETPVEKAAENVKIVEAETGAPALGGAESTRAGGAEGSNAATGATGLFIEKLMAYSHLFNEEHKGILLQLKQHVQSILDTADMKEDVQTTSISEAGTALKINVRSEKQIGTGHVDNKRGILKALKHPPHEKYAQWVIETEKKVLTWIDQLIEHLKDSKRKLTEYEIKAATDFAIWHRNMISENERLQNRIKVLEKEIAEFAAQIKIAEAQLVKRKELLAQAEDLLDRTKSHCDELREFYRKNVARRAGEFETAVAALQIYDDVMSKFQGKRVMERINAHQATGGEGFGETDLAAHVVPSEAGHEERLTAKQEARNEVVF